MRSLGFVGSAGGLVVRSGCLQRTCDLRRSSARPSRSGGAVRMDDFSMSSGQGEGSSEAESVVGVEAATEEERRILFSSAVSTKKRLSEALADAVDEAMFNLPIGCVPDLAIVYVSVAYEDRKVGLNRERLDSVVPQLRELVPGLKNIIGGTVAGVLGGDSTGACTEVEGRPAVSITFAQIPDAQIQVFHVDEGDLPSLDTSPDEWVSLVGGAKPHAKPSFILLCNSPFYSNGGLSHFVRGVDFAYPGSVKVGGVVGAPSPTPGIMYGTMKKDLLTLTSKAVFDGGVVGMTIAGGIEMETIVTQGVRGVGKRVQHAYRNKFDLNFLAVNEVYLNQTSSAACSGPVFSVRKVSQKSLLELELQTPNVPGQVMPTDRALKLVVRHASKEDQGLLFKNPLLGVADDEFKVRTEYPNMSCMENIMVTIEVLP